MAFESCRKQYRSNQNLIYKLIARPSNANKFCDCMSFDICAFALSFFPNTFLNTTQKYTHVGTIVAKIPCRTFVNIYCQTFLHVVCMLFARSRCQTFHMLFASFFKRVFCQRVYMLFAHCLWTFLAKPFYMLFACCLPNSLHVVCELLAKSVWPKYLHVVCTLFVNISCQINYMLFASS